MNKLLCTSVIRGSNRGDSHGGVYLVDVRNRIVEQKVDWRKPNIDWRGAGSDRGLRGVAFDGETVYIASSDELFAFTPEFEPIGSWRNRYPPALPRDRNSGANALSHVDKLRLYTRIRPGQTEI